MNGISFVGKIGDLGLWQSTDHSNIYLVVHRLGVSYSPKYWLEASFSKGRN